MQTEIPDTSFVHEQFIRQAIELAIHSRKTGNHPFGALLVDQAGNVMASAENTVVTDHDATCHAEMNVIRLASKTHSPAALSSATLYTSTEPCLMCCGAIHWAGIASVVFGCPAELLAKITGSADFLFPCRETLAKTTQPKVDVAGPVLEAEAARVHEGFWR